MTLPTAFDEAGIRMLDSVREIFDIVGIQFESVGFNFEEYKQFKKLVGRIGERPCTIDGLYWRTFLCSAKEHRGCSGWLVMATLSLDSPLTSHAVHTW